MGPSVYDQRTEIRPIIGSPIWSWLSIEVSGIHENSRELTPWIFFPVLENFRVDPFHTMWTHPNCRTSLRLGGLGMTKGYYLVLDGVGLMELIGGTTM